MELYVKKAVPSQDLCERFINVTITFIDFSLSFSNLILFVCCLYVAVGGVARQQISSFPLFFSSKKQSADLEICGCKNKHIEWKKKTPTLLELITVCVCVLSLMSLLYNGVPKINHSSTYL